MSVHSSSKIYPDRYLIWMCSALALLTTLAYVFIAVGFLPVSDSSVTAGDDSIIYVAAGGYFLGGLLIQLKHRWLWFIGLIINFLVIFFYFSMYLARPEILFSAGGLATKSLQVLLEVMLLVLLVRSWIINCKRSRSLEELKY